MIHYKKIHLLDNFKRESNSQAKKDKDAEAGSSLSSSGINVNHSVIDQVTKWSAVKAEKPTWEDTVKQVGGGDGSGPSTSSSQQPQDYSTTATIKTEPRLPEHSHSNGPPESNNNVYSRSEDVHYSSAYKGGHDSRVSASASGHTTTTTTRPDQAKHSSSPLLVDKSGAVEPYRDPELLKKDSEIRTIHLMHQVTLHPPGHRSIPPATTFPSQVAAPHPHTLPAHAALPQHLLPPSPFTAHPMAGHLPLSAAMDGTALASLTTLQQQQHLQQIQLMAQQQQQSQLLSSIALHNTLQTRQLELLWQQKYPNHQLPPAWVLGQFQEELLREVNPIQSRELLAERERLREREQRELLEERERERERQERERQEKERQERERQER